MTRVPRNVTDHHRGRGGWGACGWWGANQVSSLALDVGGRKRPWRAILWVVRNVATGSDAADPAASFRTFSSLGTVGSV